MGILKRCECGAVLHPEICQADNEYCVWATCDECGMMYSSKTKDMSGDIYRSPAPPWVRKGRRV